MRVRALAQARNVEFRRQRVEHLDETGYALV